MSARGGGRNNSKSAGAGACSAAISRRRGARGHEETGKLKAKRYGTCTSVLELQLIHDVNAYDHAYPQKRHNAALTVSLNCSMAHLTCFTSITLSADSLP